MFNFVEVMKAIMILLYFWAKIVYVQWVYMECKLSHFLAIIPCINPSKIGWTYHLFIDVIA
jgi:hypothetical protein